MTRPASNPYGVSKTELKRLRRTHKYRKDQRILERLDRLEKEVVRLNHRVEQLSG